jgi:hypothetical protein
MHFELCPFLQIFSTLFIHNKYPLAIDASFYHSECVLDAYIAAHKENDLLNKTLERRRYVPLFSFIHARDTRVLSII